MEYKTQKDIYILVILITTIILVSGSYLIFTKSKELSQNQQVTLKQNTIGTLEEPKEEIKLTDELKQTIKDLIPTDSNCNQIYKYEQFNNSNYIDITNPTDETQCNNNIKIFTYDYKWETTDTEVILYSYILLTDGEKYGTSYNDLYISSENIKYDNETNLTKETLIGYGGKYKFNFTKIGETFIYTSTNYIK